MNTRFNRQWLAGCLCTMGFLSALEMRGADLAALPPRSAVEQVIVVFKTHFDIGYTDLASNVVQRYRTTMIDDALKVVEQSRALPPEQRFVWTLPGWPLSKIIEPWPGQTPQRQQRVLQAFKEGRFAVHALPFTTHTELLEPEDLVRGLGFASRLSRAAGLPLPRDAKMTDVPCHSWIMPTLLRHAGVDFLHLGCNAASRSPQVPRLFFWEGPDGSRLLTMYTAESYGTGLVPPGDWPHKAWLALIHTGDNHGPPTPAEVKALMDEAQQKLPGVKVRIGRLSDFADAILSEVNASEDGVPRGPDGSNSETAVTRPSPGSSKIPVVRGDMPDTWIHGPMSDPAGARMARNIRPAIATAEALNTLLRARGVVVPDAARTIGDAYEQSLLYGEHTWGGAQYWVTRYGAGTKWSYGEGWKADRVARRFQRLEDSWAEHTAYIEKAEQLVAPLIRETIDAPGTASTATPAVLLYNPLPWPRSGVFEMASLPKTVMGALTNAGSIAVADPDGGRGHGWASGIPAMSVGRQQGLPTIPDLPPLSIRPKDGVLESKHFSVRLDLAHGTIASLLDKRSGRDLVDPAAEHGFAQYLYERFDSNQVAAYVAAYVKIKADWAVNELGKPSLPPNVRYRAASPRQWTTTFQEDRLRISATMHAAAGTDLAHAVSTKVTLHAAEPYLDLEMTLHQKAADPWPEAGWLCLPFRIDRPQFRLGRLGSILDPARDIVPGANRNLFGIQTGLALLAQDQSGVGLCPLDNPLVSLDTPGCWKYSGDFVPRRPVVYVNLFNNQWTTNFRLWNHGTWTSRVRLWAFDVYDAERSLVTPSLEARCPIQVVALGSNLAAGLAGERPAGLAVSRKGVALSAFGTNPDGNGLVLRLWELAGQAGACTVRLPEQLKVKTAQPVNLRGVAMGQPLQVEGDRFSFSLKAFAPASFMLQP